MKNGKSMKKLVFILFMSLLCYGANVQAHKKSKVKYKVNRVETPIPITTIKDIQGFYGHRMSVNRDAYLKNFPIDVYVSFIEEREHTAWDWTKAEQHGKWVESAYLSAIQSGDKELLNKVDAILNRIINSQEPEGYVGATARSYRSAERPLRGMDVYELYFVVHAFLTVYEETDNQQALNAAVNLCDYILRYIGPGKLEFWPSNLRYPENIQKELSGGSDFAGHAVHYSWEGTMLIDPVMRLYELTGNKDYLKWGQWITENIDKWSGWNAFSNLDKVADGTMGIHELQPYVHSHTFHMNFLGFLRLYRVTGDESLLRKVKGAWEDINKRQMYITGGVSVAEHYEPGYIKPITGHVVESCATMSWMQLCQALLELTSEAKYAEAMERLMINHVFAAQDAESGVCRYHTAPNGTKPDGYFHGPDCCTASGHRIISLLPTFFFAENGNDFYINQYLSCKYEGKDFSFKIGGNYPETESFDIEITTEKAKNKALNLRIPVWCESPRISVNGVVVENVQPGSYLKLNRKWKKGDLISVSYPMKLQWVKRENHSKYVFDRLPGGEMMYREEPTDRVPYALLRGPVVYALDMVWNKQLCNDDVNMDKDIRIKTDMLPVQIANINENIIGPVYKTKALYKKSEVEVILTPFTTIGQWFRPNESKPNHSSDAFTYGIWLYNTEVK